MNAVTVDALPYTAVEKRFVSSTLLAMLCVVIGLTIVTVTVGEDEPVLNTRALLALLGPIAMFLLAWIGANQFASGAEKVERDSPSRVVGGSGDNRYFPVWLEIRH